MKVVVIDGQGGNIGRAIIEEIRSTKPGVQIIAIGTNASATTNMLKGGAHQGATGENPVKVCTRDADYILGPVGIAMADAMLGEITPSIAEAVGASSAHKILIPINKCVTIAGVDESLSLNEYIRLAVSRIGE
ncbi:MAG: DUF3842 family protein [Spirochaetales bacterium]|nr:DUF3842 family protein [Candidatus Physcosoma equi]